MRRITYWTLSTISVLVLLFGYHTSTSGPTSTGAPTSVQAPISGSGSGSSGSTTSSSGATSSGSGSNPPASADPSTTSTGSTAPSTVTGQVAQTRWGPVQVELTVTGSKVTDVSVLQYPSGNGRDEEINSRALPVLIQETLDAQSANIDMVSGATVTSDGYLQSLQSALDQTGL